MYTRPGCHLCEEALDVLEALRDERGFTLVEHDILGDAEAFERFRFRVPVLFVDGVERLSLRFSRADIEAVLDEAARSGAKRPGE